MSIAKKLNQWFIQPIIKRRISRASVYEHNGIKLHIPAGVFHPAYFFSTKYLLNTILQLDLKNKLFLELGAGNGLISISAAKHGALVTSSDISEKVIANLKINALPNNCEITCVHSDLFDNIPLQHFDIIAINPPYYPKQARNELEMAWYCGTDFEYFRKLFPQLAAYLSSTTLALMILSEECEIEKIKRIAQQSNLELQHFSQKKIKWEQNFIFSIQKK